MRAAILRALAGALVGIAALLGVEGLLALAGLPDPGLYEGDPATLWFLRPGLDREVDSPATGTRFRVRTNALGLRGPPPPERGPWTLALGCSTTFGWGVEADETWPARLAALTGAPVVNGGVPGWSSQQGRLGSGRWLDLGPSRVVVAYIVRDAQPAARPDHLARPSPWPWRTHLGRLLAGLRPARPEPPPGPPPDPARTRVPPDRFRQNLLALAARARPAEVVLLAFPQPWPLDPWVEAMRATGLPVLAPRLPRSAFFEGDPVHLTPEGHGLLAEWLAASLARAPSAPPPR